MATSPFLSEIQIFACNFAPQNWAFCNGQLLPILQNQALFSLLGTTYGGNGVSTFALPDLRGRAPMAAGAGHLLGESGGSETVTLVTNQMPAHVHTVDVSGLTVTARAKNGSANQQTPVGNMFAIEATNVLNTYSSAAPDANMNSSAAVVSGSITAANAGSALAHENRQPYVALNYCIALVGEFPSSS